MPLSACTIESDLGSDYRRRGFRKKRVVVAPCSCCARVAFVLYSRCVHDVLVMCCLYCGPKIQCAQLRNIQRRKTAGYSRLVGPRHRDDSNRTCTHTTCGGPESKPPTAAERPRTIDSQQSSAEARPLNNERTRISLRIIGRLHHTRPPAVVRSPPANQVHSK